MIKSECSSSRSNNHLHQYLRRWPHFLISLSIFCIQVFQMVSCSKSFCSLGTFHYSDSARLIFQSDSLLLSHEVFIIYIIAGILCTANTKHQVCFKYQIGRVLSLCLGLQNYLSGIWKSKRWCQCPQGARLLGQFFPLRSPITQWIWFLNHNKAKLKTFSRGKTCCFCIFFSDLFQYKHSIFCNCNIQLTGVLQSAWQWWAASQLCVWLLLYISSIFVRKNSNTYIKIPCKAIAFVSSILTF